MHKVPKNPKVDDFLMRLRKNLKVLKAYRLGQKGWEYLNNFPKDYRALSDVVGQYLEYQHVYVCVHYYHSSFYLFPLPHLEYLSHLDLLLKIREALVGKK